MNPENQHRVVWIDIWRDIESAPKDGTEILVSNNEFMALVSWYDGEWVEAARELDYMVPTHWMPLPPLPKDS